MVVRGVLMAFSKFRASIILVAHIACAVSGLRVGVGGYSSSQAAAFGSAGMVGPITKVKVALYGGPGALFAGKLVEGHLNAALCHLGAGKVHRMKTGDEVASDLKNTNYDIVVFPGGSGREQRDAIGLAGVNAVTRFVKNGGGFIGICAGAFLAVDHIGLLGPAKMGMRIRKAGGTSGWHSMQFTKPNVKNFHLDERWEKNVNVFYRGGPIFNASKLPSSVTVLAKLRDGSPKMKNTPAVMRTEFGKGRVWITNSHFEAEHAAVANLLTRNSHVQLFASVIAWLAGKTRTTLDHHDGTYPCPICTKSKIVTAVDVAAHPVLHPIEIANEIRKGVFR